MQFFASVSYIKPFFLILVSLCVVMFQWLSDVVPLFPLPAILCLLFPLSLLLFPLLLRLLHLYVVSPHDVYPRTPMKVGSAPSPFTLSPHALVTQHGKYTSLSLYVYYCVAQVAAWQPIKERGESPAKAKRARTVTLLALRLEDGFNILGNHFFLCQI